MSSLAVGTVIILAGISWADGDSGRTAELGNVRLWVANAAECETSHSYKRPCGDAATMFVSSLTYGRTIQATVRGWDGSRNVVEMHLRSEAGYGLDVATELLRAGLACRDDRFDPEGRYAWAERCGG